MTKKEETSKNDEFEELQKQCDDYLNGWKRARADYENLKKEMAKEKEAFVKFANLNLIVSIIPVYNNLKIALESVPADLENNDWVKGVSQIKEQLREFLRENGVEEMAVKVGDEFNPEIHEAVEQLTKNNQQETKNEEENKISKVVSDGYKMHGRVIMAARVIVN